MIFEKNIKCELSYDGTNFHGFQIQPNHRTIQGELEKSIRKITNENVKIIASGRTDAGVHAKKQICNFITKSNIPADRWKYALNSDLPNEISINKTMEVPLNFHSRYDVTTKVYRYYILNTKEIDIFRRLYTWHVPQNLNIEKMQSASKSLIGKHDFTSFSSAKTEVQDKIRTMYKTSIEVINDEIIFEICGDGFLYNMVRIIIGTLVDIGKNDLKSGKIEDILLAKNRAAAGKTAPAKGLYLWDVIY